MNYAVCERTAAVEERMLRKQIFKKLLVLDGGLF
jgi:hypothetical protein